MKVRSISTHEVWSHWSPYPFTTIVFRKFLNRFLAAACISTYNETTKTTQLNQTQNRYINLGFQAKSVLGDGALSRKEYVHIEKVNAVAIKRKHTKQNNEKQNEPSSNTIEFNLFDANKIDSE